jgi:hypothetical protein
MTSSWIRTAALAALLAAAPLARAFETVDTLPWPSAGAFYPGYTGEEVRPWSIFAYGGAMWDDNVRRTPDDETSDFLSRIGLGGRYTARVVGRQSILLDAYGEYRNYDKLSQFDHFAYGLRGAWLWEIGNQLSGTASYRRVYRMADIGETSSNIQDMITSDYFDVAGAYRFHPEFRLTGGIGTTRVAHDGRDIDTTHSWGWRSGIEYVSGLGNTVGLEFRHSEGNAPVDEVLGLGVFDDNDYEENEIAVTLFYAFGEQLRLRGRLGHTERTYSQLSAANFSGTTGRGAIEWQPGVKTLFTFEVFREPDPVIDAAALYVDRRGVAAGVAWAMTYKLVTSVRAVQERRIYKGDPLVAIGLPQRDETLHFLRFGLGWEPERHWQLSTALDFGTRDSNFLGRDYDYTAVALNLRYSF